MNVVMDPITINGLQLDSGGWIMSGFTTAPNGHRSKFMNVTTTAESNLGVNLGYVTGKTGPLGTAGVKGPDDTTSAVLSLGSMVPSTFTMGSGLTSPTSPLVYYFSVDGVRYVIVACGCSVGPMSLGNPALWTLTTSILAGTTSISMCTGAGLGTLNGNLIIMGFGVDNWSVNMVASMVTVKG